MPTCGRTLCALNHRWHFLVTGGFWVEREQKNIFADVQVCLHVWCWRGKREEQRGVISAANSGLNSSGCWCCCCLRVVVVVVVSSFIQILCLPKNPIQCFLLFAACYSPPVRSPKTSWENVENNLDFSRARELKMVETICSFFFLKRWLRNRCCQYIHIYIYINVFSIAFVFSVSCFKGLST